MISGIWGKKIGMTQFFSGDQRVVPVTVIETSGWRILRVKNDLRDGYNALVMGCPREKYINQEFSLEWLKQPNKYFASIKEVALNSVQDVSFEPGKMLELDSVISSGATVDAAGITIGRGFQGAMKRHGFSGGRASHGDKLGRGPGSLSFMRTQGRVRKGKRLPGHMGVTSCQIKNLEVVKIESESGVLFLKGSVPGKTGSFIFLRKCE